MTRTCFRPGLMDRRQWLAGVAGVLSGSMAGRALAAPPPALLPPSVALGDELRLALAQGQPLVVLVSLEGCPFCKVVARNFLAPLQRQEGLPVVLVDMRNARPLRDFAGASLTHDQVTRAWGIKVAPTVLFFGRDGAEVAERMVGGYLPDFYGAYLDERLQQARRSVRTG